MKPKTTTLFLLPISLLTLQSCIKNDPCGNGTPPTHYYTLASEARAKTPYFNNPAFDTISYLSDKGDTLTFLKTSTDSTWFCMDGSGSPDCGYEKNCYLGLRNTYKTIKGNGKFEVSHFKKGLYDSRIFSDFVLFKFGNYFIYATDYKLGTATGGVNFFDSIAIIGNYYYKVNKYLEDNDNPIYGEFLLNPMYGIIQANDKLTGNIFSLIPKK